MACSLVRKSPHPNPPHPYTVAQSQQALRRPARPRNATTSAGFRRKNGEWLLNVGSRC